MSNISLSIWRGWNEYIYSNIMIWTFLIFSSAIFLSFYIVYSQLISLICWLLTFSIMSQRFLNWYYKKTMIKQTNQFPQLKRVADARPLSSQEETKLGCLDNLKRISKPLFSRGGSRISKLEQNSTPSPVSNTLSKQKGNLK